MSLFKKVIIICIIFVLPVKAERLKDCKWDNRKGTPCLVVSKTPNTSEYSMHGVDKVIITKKGSNLSTTSHFLILPKGFLF